MKNYFNVFVVSFVIIININSQNSVPNDWYFGNPGEGFNGISVKKAYNEILKNKKTKTVIVAIIDSGIDINHEDLSENIWVNPGEIPNNGKDDDKNGYIDDINGWNFIGGPDGKNVGPDSYEATRIFGSLKYKFENANPAKLNKTQKKEYDTFIRSKEIVEREIKNNKTTLDQLDAVERKVMTALDAVQSAVGKKTFDKTTLDSLKINDDYEIMLGKNLASEYLLYPDVKSIDDIKNIIKDEIDQDRKTPLEKLEYSYNIDFDPRVTIVKDNYGNVNEKYYGNNDVKGPDPLHGTHVGGTIGAIRNNNIGMDGIAPNVKLMSVRAVPDGDERDKDVANAIRYAVDNGASIINMSFGKGFSPDKNVVDEAVKYAAKKDVLLVHAAGNDNENNDEIANFPNASFEKKTGFLCKKQQKANNWISVGALSYKGGENAPAPFSNYGAKEVDVFAPGMKIYSTLPNDKYAPLQGTSMASPVVAGVAAAIRSVFPALTAQQVKEAIMKSVTPLNQEVFVPGSKSEKISFSKLCVSGGVINLDKALTYAATMKGKKKIKEIKA